MTGAFHTLVAAMALPGAVHLSLALDENFGKHKPQNPCDGPVRGRGLDFCAQTLTLWS